MLTQIQKKCRVKFSEENFVLYGVDTETFLARTVTGDETWL
jgi:hypothetical protein